MSRDWTAISDEATVNRLARIIRDGTETQCDRALAQVIASHGREDGGRMWDQACQLVDREAQGGAA